MALNKLSLEKFVVQWFKTLMVVLGLLVVIVGSVFAVMFFEEQKKQKAVAILYQKQKALKSLIKEEQNPLSFLQTQELIWNKEMDNPAKEYEQAIVSYQSIKMATYFAMDLADVYYRYGKKQKAKTLLSLFSTPKKKKLLFFPSSSFSSLSQLAIFQSVTYLMNAEKCDKALELLDTLLLQDSAKAFHAEARMQKALCLQKNNRYDEALLEYQRVLAENPDTYVGNQAQGFEKILTLEKKLSSKK